MEGGRNKLDSGIQHNKHNTNWFCVEELRNKHMYIVMIIVDNQVKYRNMVYTSVPSLQASHVDIPVESEEHHDSEYEHPKHT